MVLKMDEKGKHLAARRAQEQVLYGGTFDPRKNLEIREIIGESESAKSRAHQRARSRKAGA